MDKIFNLIRKIKKYKEINNYTIESLEKVNRKKNIIKYNILTLLFFIKIVMIINIFSQIKNNKINFYYFHNSKITLRIKGVGEVIY